MKVKICGLTRIEDAEHAVRAGADYLGLNFWPRSKRHVSVETGAALAAAARALDPRVAIVGLFVDQPLAHVREVHDAVGLDVVQLHGDEGADVIGAVRAYTGVWKAHLIHGPESLAAVERCTADAQVLDAPSAGRGGSGTSFAWGLAAGLSRRVVLAGGLTPDNVAAAIATAGRLFAVDVASGVERAPGVKDPARVSAFIAAARAAAR